MIFSNQLLLGFGNLLLPNTATGPVTVLTPLALDPMTGVSQITLQTDNFQAESEILFQAIVFGPSSPNDGHATNRLRLESNN